MVFVVVGGLATAFMLLLQGLHVLRSGDLRPFFEPPVHSLPSRATLALDRRIAGAGLYIVPSIAIFWILAGTLYRHGMHRTLAWFSDHGIGLVGGLFLLTYGVVTLMRPDIVAHTIRRTYPDEDLAGNAVYRFLRILGVLVSVLALFILKGL
jgi:hypothetical protein